MSRDRFTYETAAVRETDVGLQQFMRSVYNTMTIGLGVTGVVAFAGANIEPLRQLITMPLVYMIVALAPLVFLFTGLSHRRAMAMSPEKLRTTFYLFSALMGLSMSTIFMVYSGQSIARAFFVTAGTFAAMSLYGYTTKRDLTAMGSFLAMGVIGLLIAMLVNLFFQSAMVHFVVSVAGVLIFTGLAAWDSQRLKETYSAGAHMQDANARLATMGALSLYITFINLFQFILSFMGSNRE